MDRNPKAMFLSVMLATAMSLCVPITLDSGSDVGAEVSSTPSVLRMGFLQKIDSLNPYVGMNDASYVFYGLVYDALTCVGNDLDTVPDLAKEWWIVPTTDPEMQSTGAPFGSVWQYNLTTDALWTDGEPFTADDVVWNIQLNAQNYEAMWAYQPYSYFIKDAVKVDDSTVRVHFYDRLSGTPMPASYAYQLSIPMLPKHMLQNKSAFDIGFNWTGLFESPDMPTVGTGPFMGGPNIRNEWLAGNQITLFKNPNCHWGADYGKYVQFDKIVMYFYDDVAAMSYALQNNQLDVAAFPPQAYRAIKNGVESGSIQNVTTFEGPKITQYWTEIGINMNEGGPNPSRLDHTIREAMAMATDKTYIVQNYYIGMAEEGSTLIAPINQFWHYEPNATEKFQFNITAANALLESAGYRDVNSDGTRECTSTSYAVTEGLVSESMPLQYQMLVRREYPEEKYIAVYLQNQWAQVGIRINYQIVDESLLSTMVYSYSYDTMIWYWSADVDPNYQLFVESKAAWNGWSDNKYYNVSYEENYTRSVNAMDRDQRKVYVDNCQRVNYLDAAYIILAYPNQTYAWRTDTFTGWGDWAADPGRSLDNYWTGNPLFFDLVPLQGTGNSVPIISSLQVSPNPVLPNATAVFTVVARDWDADALSFYIEFGDGGAATASGLNTTGLQYANFTHSYELPGTYNVTTWVDDNDADEGHNISRTFNNRVLVGSLDWLVASIDPSPLVLDMRESVSLSANLTWNGVGLGGTDNISYLWYVDPMDIGSFNFRARQSTVFTVGSSPGSGNISCRMIYYDIDATANASLTVVPAVLGQVTVSPPGVAMMCNVSRIFTAHAYDTNGYLIEGVIFNWTIEGLQLGEYALDVTTGPSVEFAGFVEGVAWLNATATVGAVTTTGSSEISLVGSLPERSVSYQWHDMFNVPFGEWYDLRWNVYHEEQPLSDTYPYIFKTHSPPPGNDDYYTNMRLDIGGRNMSELNMNSHPEFLPFLGTARGGNAEINWYMQYLTKAEMARRLNGTEAWADGWVISLNGTTTMDKQAAMAVLNVTSAGFDDFASWWAVNQNNVKNAYSSWLLYEGNKRLDIYNMYWYPLTWLTFNLTAQKVADKVVLTYDIVSWGMEALMTRWLHDAFMPTEWYFEDFNLDATIGPDMTDLAISTAVAYAAYAWESIQTPGEPCWVWEGMLQDVVHSGIKHSRSAYDPYADETYVVRSPGSVWYGQSMNYDYTPGAFNLSTGEMMSIEWPSGPQQFIVNRAPGVAANVSSNMTVKYSEPMDSDLPGQAVTDSDARTITFTGPIDMWAWSKNQTSHAWLVSEWSRVGLLPHGVPWVEFNMVNTSPPIADGGSNQFVFVGDIVTFDGSASWDDLLIVNYTWEFWYNGSFVQLYGVSPTFVFSTAGVYNVTLTVCDTSNQTNSTVVWITVEVEIPEFPIVLTPVAGMLAVFLLTGIPRRWKRRKRG